MDDDDDTRVTTHRFTRVDILPLVLDLLEGVLDALHKSSMLAYNMAARHANYKHEQAKFRTEAALDIERITEGNGDG